MPDYIRFSNTNSDPNLVESPEPDSESDSGAFAGSDSEQDYGQLIYEYLVNQEEIDYKSELQDINSNLEWIVALLLLMITLYLFNYVRRWVNKLTGGKLDDVC